MKFSQLLEKHKINPKVGNLVIEAIKQELLNGNEIGIMNFGSFRLKTKESTKITIPGTTKKIKVPSKTRMLFKPAKNFKILLEGVKL